MGEKQVTLCFAIPVFNDAEGLKRTLQSLTNLEEFRNGKVSVIVQDNSSTDGSFEAANEISTKAGSLIQVGRNDWNLGFHGNLLALAGRCESDYIWFLGAGEEIVVQSVRPLLEFLSETHRGEVQMGIVAAAPSVTASEPAFDSRSWTFTSLRSGKDQCFRESISLNIVRAQLALEVLESAKEKGDIQRDSWPHLEMALGATTALTFAVADPPLVRLSDNGNGWWYHSPIGMDIYLRQIELLKDSIQSGIKISWADTLYKNQVSWGFAAMAFEMRMLGSGFQKNQEERARELGLSGFPLLATRLIRTLPGAILILLQQSHKLLRRFFD